MLIDFFLSYGEKLFTSSKYNDVLKLTRSPYGLECTDEEMGKIF